MVLGKVQEGLAVWIILHPDLCPLTNYILQNIAVCQPVNPALVSAKTIVLFQFIFFQVQSRQEPFGRLFNLPDHQS